MNDKTKIIGALVIGAIAGAIGDFSAIVYITA